MQCEIKLVYINGCGVSQWGKKDINLIDVRETDSVVRWSDFLATDPDVRVRFPALSDFLRSSRSETGSTQPREYDWGATCIKKKVAASV
jgi:hypothetical protein